MSERSRPGAEETPAVGGLPYVDGSVVTPEELRAQVAREADPQVQRIEELRDELAATVDELGSRLDVRPRVSQLLSRVRPAAIAAAVLLAAVVLWRRRRPRGAREKRLAAARARTV
ncbi:MAG: DUF3618 domain-containing protein [Pseudonocardiales bacterium]|nr:DUF3618 domain-containing protein [Pseudonocardiales bacterium]